MFVFEKFYPKLCFQYFLLVDSEMVQKPPQQCISLIRSSCDGICDCSIEGVANCQSRGLKSIPNDLPKDIMEL